MEGRQHRCQAVGKSLGGIGVRRGKLVILIFALAACQSKMDVQVKNGAGAAAQLGMQAMAVTARRPVVITAGNQIVLTGVGFRPTMTVALADTHGLSLAGSKAVGVKVESDTRAVLDVPKDLATGPLNLTVNQDGAVQTISLIFDANGSDTLIFTNDAADVCSDHQFFDANGVMHAGTKLCNEPPAACARDGETDCLATPAFPAAQSDGLAAKVVTGQSVAGIIGSAAAPSDLADCVPGGTDCIARSPLAVVNPAALSAGDIRTGVSIAGITGTLDPGASPSPCASDGDGSGCLTTLRYKSMDTDPSVISPWDIRSGKTAGGIAGSIVFYKNMANTSLFDRTTGTGGVSGLDIYDTIDDYNNGSTFPTQNPGGWTQTTDANWLRDPQSDTDTNNVCNGTEDCVYKDQITSLFWIPSSSTRTNWEDAITYCDAFNGSSYGGYSSGWRLPTQKELQQAYVDGVWGQRSTLNVAADYTWTSTSNSMGAAGSAYIVALYYGYVSTQSKANTYYAMCVR